MKISGDGIGLAEDLSGRANSSHGTKIGTTLVEQFRGRIETWRQNGATFVITFPAEYRRQR